MMKLARAQRQDALPLLRLYRLCANQPQSTWNEYYPSPVEVREDLDFGGLYVLRDAHRIVACASLILPEEGAETAQGVNYPCVTVGVSEAKGVKCPRCWMHSTAANAEGLCPRCAAVIAKMEIDI